MAEAEAEAAGHAQAQPGADKGKGARVPPYDRLRTRSSDINGRDCVSYIVRLNTLPVASRRRAAPRSPSNHTSTIDLVVDMSSRTCSPSVSLPLSPKKNKINPNPVPLLRHPPPSSFPIY